MNTDALHFLRDLIAIPSVNPMGTGGAEAVERGVADYIENVLRRAAVACERQTVAEGRENLIAILSPSADGPHLKRGGLMLNSHMDTVPAANMAIEPFDPVIRGGRVYGRGACDAKGAIAAMLAAFLAHAERRERRCPILLALTADEEYSFAGAWKLIERDLPISACVVGEPTGLMSVIAHKGVARWRIKVRGTSAHGATPHLGRSAIYDGARVGLALEAYNGELGARAGHPLLGQPTINVGRIWGGQSVNMVPDACEFEIERRLLPGEDGREAVHECEAWIRERLGEEIELIVEDPFLVDPPLDTPRDAPVVQALARAHTAVLNKPGAIEGAHYGTDGSKFALAGFETVVCGPGDIKQAHTSTEFIEIVQMELAVRFYDNLLTNWPPF